jgi:hypothetical protein
MILVDGCVFDINFISKTHMVHKEGSIPQQFQESFNIIHFNSSPLLVVFLDERYRYHSFHPK